MRVKLLLTLCVLLVSGLARPMHADTTKPEPASPLDITKAKDWPDSCREYLPKKNQPCRIDFDMSQTRDGASPPPVHKDVAVWPGQRGQAVVILHNSSPFAACSLTTTPGPLGRDMSPAVTGLLTGLAGFGGTLGGLPAASGDQASHNNPSLSPDEIAAKEQQISALLEVYATDSAPAYTSLHAALVDAGTIKANLKYSYPGDDEARHALETIYASESDLQAQQIPEAKESLEFQQRLEAIESALDKLESQGGSQVTSWVRDFRSNRIPAATMHINNLPAAIVWLTDAKAAGAKLIDFLATLSAPGTG